MESIVYSVVAGVIAAVSATAVLGCAKCVRQLLAKREDEKYIRDLFIRGRKRVMESTKNTTKAWMQILQQMLYVLHSTTI